MAKLYAACMSYQAGAVSSSHAQRAFAPTSAAKRFCLPDAVVYECACGFEASTAVAMHKHLSTSSSGELASVSTHHLLCQTGNNSMASVVLDLLEFYRTGWLFTI
jgi:hypothetical protein